MTADDRFLAAIRAAPADDTPRLVFADYLDDAGDPDRAEFIRLQIGLARGELGADAEARARELLAAHRRTWKLPGVRGSQFFRRGFVEGLYTLAADLLADADTIGREPLVTDIRLSAARGYLTDIAALPWFDRVEALDLRANVGIFDEFVPAFQDRPLPSLRRLVLQNVALWPADLDHLADAMDERLTGITALNLSGNYLGDDGAGHLAGEPAFGRLRELVQRCDMIAFSDAVHAAGATALAGSETLTDLRHLDLSGHYVGDAGLVALVGSPIAENMRSLSLANNRVGEKSGRWAEAIVESPHLGRLRRLNLSGTTNSVSHDAAEALVSWGRLPADCVIDLTNCPMADRTRRLLETGPHAARFRLADAPPEDAPR